MYPFDLLAGGSDHQVSRFITAIAELVPRMAVRVGRGLIIYSFTAHLSMDKINNYFLLSH